MCVGNKCQIWIIQRFKQFSYYISSGALWERSKQTEGEKKYAKTNRHKKKKKGKKDRKKEREIEIVNKAKTIKEKLKNKEGISVNFDNR